MHMHIVFTMLFYHLNLLNVLYEYNDRAMTSLKWARGAINTSQQITTVPVFIGVTAE